jgi:hypothetical protein
LNVDMVHGAPAGTTIYRSRSRIRWVRVVGLLIVIAAIAVALGQQLPESISSTGLVPTELPRDQHHGALGEADGAVPDGTTVFDDDVPGVANLDSDLLAAVREAANDAEGDGVEFLVDSGWRSRAYQEQLLKEAISKYGSEEQAAQWVATPSTSSHVSGDAVDIGPSDAALWLSEHGSEYGLCQIYANEAWHYELRPEAADDGCPAMYADPTHDPRMRQ